MKYRTNVKIYLKVAEKNHFFVLIYPGVKFTN